MPQTVFREEYVYKHASLHDLARLYTIAYMYINIVWMNIVYIFES
jgi:hypothetical protein